MSDSEDEWTPPSEAEMKVIQAKRERSDKISKVMGDYLLKGYKMLATSCRVCYTVELQNKQGGKFCVACQEVDCHETSKDDPALSQQAASRIIEEEAFSSVSTVSPVSASNSRTATLPARTEPQPALARPASPASPLVLSDLTPPTSASLGARPRLTSRPPVCESESDSSLLAQTRDCLRSKLAWANSELQIVTSPERATQLVILAREIVQTLGLASLASLHQHSPAHS